MKYLLLHMNKEAFLLILKNNIKGCIINILGGFSLGLGTIGLNIVRKMILASNFACGLVLHL